MTQQELRFAQRDVYNASQHLASAGLRLRGTVLEKDYEKLFKSLNKLNTKLIKLINN